MGIKPTFAAEVLEDLTLRFINPAKIKQHLLPLKGQLVMITAEKLRKHRTDDQNRYYRGVVLKTIADNCGYRGNHDFSQHNKTPFVIFWLARINYILIGKHARDFL